METIYIIAIFILTLIACSMPYIVTRKTVAKLEANGLLKEKIIFYKDDKLYKYFLEKYKSKLDQK